MKERLANIALAVTHGGIFHTDDVAAYALLCVVCQRLVNRLPGALARTRDRDIIDGGDVVFDVGGEYDPEKGLLDHHQRNGLPVRKCGIWYSSFGLMFEWLYPALLELGFNEQSLAEFELSMVLPIDASDNGQDLVSEYAFNVDGSSVQPIPLQRVVNNFRPRWDQEEDMDQKFLLAAEFMRGLIGDKLDQLKAGLKARGIVEDVVASQGTEAKVLDFGRGFFPWQGPLLDSGSLALFVVFFDNASGSWRVQAVPKEIGSFGNRASLPTMDDLPEESRLKDGLSFIHKAGFIAGGTKEACLALAEYAVSRL